MQKGLVYLVVAKLRPWSAPEPHDSKLTANSATSSANDMYTLLSSSAPSTPRMSKFSYQRFSPKTRGRRLKGSQLRVDRWPGMYTRILFLHVPLRQKQPVTAAGKDYLPTAYSRRPGTHHNSPPARRRLSLLPRKVCQLHLKFVMTVEHGRGGAQKRDE